MRYYQRIRQMSDVTLTRELDAMRLAASNSRQIMEDKAVPSVIRQRAKQQHLMAKGKVSAVLRELLSRQNGAQPTQPNL